MRAVYLPHFSLTMPKNTNISQSETSELDVVKLVNKHKAAEIIGVSPSTLKQYRRAENSTLIEGVHYHRWNTRTIRYNPDLLADWAINRKNPEAHRKTIERYLTSIVSRQSSKRGRKAG